MRQLWTWIVFFVLCISILILVVLRVYVQPEFDLRPTVHDEHIATSSVGTLKQTAATSVRPTSSTPAIFPDTSGATQLAR